MGSSLLVGYQYVSEYVSQYVRAIIAPWTDVAHKCLGMLECMWMWVGAALGICGTGLHISGEVVM